MFSNVVALGVGTRRDVFVVWSIDHFDRNERENLCELSQIQRERLVLLLFQSLYVLFGNPLNKTTRIERMTHSCLISAAFWWNLFSQSFSNAFACQTRMYSFGGSPIVILDRQDQRIGSTLGWLHRSEYSTSTWRCHGWSRSLDSTGCSSFGSLLSSSGLHASSGVRRLRREALQRSKREFLSVVVSFKVRLRDLSFVSRDLLYHSTDAKTIRSIISLRWWRMFLGCIGNSLWYGRWYHRWSTSKSIPIKFVGSRTCAPPCSIDGHSIGRTNISGIV